MPIPLRSRWILCLTLLTLGGAPGLWANGSQETTYQKASGSQTFTGSIDLTDLKPGAYNVLIKTTDAAGNVSYSGPFNIFNDPDSALPIVSVANPTPNMVVRANLNIVGAATATEGVGRVVVRVDGGEWFTASGRGFWSYTLDISNLKDGVHSIDVRGIDKNGLEGPIVTTPFILDQFKPVLAVSSHASGDRVGGDIDLRGTLVDDNGLQGFAWSTDGGTTYRPVDLLGDFKAPLRPWGLRLSTRSFPDGPLVVWLKGTDKQGSEIKQAFLLFVDNTPPLIEVLSPAPDAGLHGKVRYAGKVTKQLGIASLTARYGKNPAVPITVVPGNPFWAVDLDLTNEPGNEVYVTFEAVDTAGNKGSLTVRRKIDLEAALPTLVLNPVLDKGTFSDPMNVTGTLVAPDGPAGVAWSLNGSPEVVQDSLTSFSFPLPGLLSGNNRITLIPIDALNKRGHPVNATFTAILPDPAVTVVSAVLSDQEIPFTPGMSLAPDKKTRLRVALKLPNPLKELVWSLAGAPTVKVTAQTRNGLTTADLAVPEDPPFGYVPFTVTATDVYGKAFTATSYLNILNFAKPQGKDGLALVDARVGQSPLVLTPETPLVGYFSSGKIRSVDLSFRNGPAGAMAASFDGPLVTLKSVKDGRFEGVKLRIVNEKGRVYDTDLGTVMSDIAGPVVALSSPKPGSWSTGTLRVEGQVSDSGGLSKFEWSVDNGKSWFQLDLPSGLSPAFQRTIDLPGPDNIVNLLLRATDNAGRTGTVLTVVRRDTQAPDMEVTLPSVFEGAKGTVLVTGRFRDDGALVKAEVALAKKNVSLPVDRPFVLPLDLATYATTPFLLRVTDLAGNTSEKSFSLALTPAPEKAPPRGIEILFPTPAMKGLNGIIPVVGRVTGFSSAPTVTVKGTSLTEKKLELNESGYFTLDTDSALWTDRSLVFSAVGDPPAPDPSSTTVPPKETAQVFYRIPYDEAADLPQARFLPLPDKLVLTGNVTASGWIGDNRGVVGWTSQLDSGAKVKIDADSSKPATGTFLIDLGVPAPGNHRLTVIPVDATGKEGPPATVDFTQTVPSGPVQFTNVDFGMSLVLNRDSRLQGRVPSLNTWKRLEVRFADVSTPDVWTGPYTQIFPVKSKTEDGVWLFDTPIPADLPYARIGIAIRGEDSLGQKVEGRTFFHRIWAKDPLQINDNEGLVFTDTALREDGRIESEPGTVFAGTFRGRALKTVTLVPPQPAIDAAFAGDRITLVSKDEGIFGPFVVTATTIDNEVFTARAMTMFSDKSGPLVELAYPLTGEWERDTALIQGKISDPSGIGLAEVSVDSGATWQALTIVKGAFSMKIPLTSPDGLLGVIIRTEDKGGHKTTIERWVTKDTVAPVFTIVTPPADLKVNGLTSIVGTTSEAGKTALVEYSDDAKTFKAADGLDVFRFNLDFASYAKLPSQWYIRTTDAAGNQAVTPVTFNIDQEADKPVVQIQTPTSGEVIRSDFKITGMVFDDDGVKSLSWRLDGGPWLKVDNVTNFSFPIELLSLKDNEHIVDMQAEDIYGTKGNITSSTFRVSLSEPMALLLAPDIEKTVSGVVSLIGAGFDRNGIQDVSVSLDNGLSWNKATFKRKEDEALTGNANPMIKEYLPKERQEWEWRIDTKTLKDGTYSVLTRTTDTYGTEALFTSLVNLDNTPPIVTLNSPEDGTPLLDVLKLEGRASDNVTLVSLKALLRPIDAPNTVADPKAATSAGAAAGSQAFDLPVTPTFNQEFKLGNGSPLVPGWYNLRVEAKDAAGSTTYVARNVQIGSANTFDKIELLYPLSGETVSGDIVVAGRITSRTKIDKALINLDGKTKVVVDVDEKGFFQIDVNPSMLSDGEHQLQASVQVTASVTLQSEPRDIVYRSRGPYIHVKTLLNGDYVTNRPWVEGIAGWMTGVPDAPVEPTHRVTAVEASLDNGKTFSKGTGGETWKYRLESLELPDGALPLVFRATFADGSTALQRLLVTVNQTPPTVNLTKALDNARVYGKIDLSGYTSDKSGGSKVEIALRTGDKAAYAAPTFIQGFYWDGHILGATNWEQALGFAFSNDAVKIQAQLGQAPQTLANGSQSRFRGTVAGMKIIANIANIPFNYFFGPDWDWYSMSVAVGSNFSLFSQSKTFLDFSGTELDLLGKPVSPQFLGSIIAQWEWAKVTLKNNLFFRTYSWYGEVTVWFISSEVKAEAHPSFSTGVRVGIW